MIAADTSATNTASSNLRQWLGRYKEFLSIFGGTLDIFLKTSPLALFPSAVLLWVYLKRLGWIEVFLPSVGSTAGLITLLAASAALAIGLLLQFCFPSLAISAVAGFFKSQSASNISTPKLAALCLLPAASWVATYGVAIWAWPGLGMWSIAIATASAGIAALVLVYWLRDYVETSKTSGKWKVLKIVAAAWWPLLGALFSTSPLLVSLWLFEKQPFANTYPVLVYLICALLSIAGLLPGLAAVRSQISRHSAARTVAVTSGVGLSVAYILAGLVMILTPVSAVILGNAGVYKVPLQTYQILKPELAYSMRAVHLSVYPVRGSAKVNDQPIQFVDGFVRYSFGGLTLICSTPFQPEAVLKDDVQDAARKGLPDPYLLAGDWCIPVRSDDILEVRRDKAARLAKRPRL